ncbi:MAG: tyrosine protein phosphatase [Betaproteobacteria bacterium]|nr:tyrosine protein phosphatase [Betaproteobacteria bacterium]
MIPEIFWIEEIQPLRLAIAARPRSEDWLRDEIAGWQLAKISTVVSLLEPHEVRDLGLIEESVICTEGGVDFLSYPIPDRGTPISIRTTAKFVDDMLSRLHCGEGVGIHCRASIGRSGLLAVCVLSRLGVRFKEIFPILSRARKRPVPDTPAQVDWVKNFALLKTGE